MSAPQAVPASPLGALRLTCLGAATLSRVRDGADDEVVLAAGKPFALVTYLHCAPGKAASRDHLVDILWADLEPDAAKHALRQALWFIRQRLGADTIRTCNGDLALELDLVTDRDAFLRAIDTGDVEHAASAYGGDFLPAFATPGGLEFEHWAETERARLRLLFARAAESVARRQLTHGHARDARSIAQRVRDTDPLSETGWRLLLETLIAAGDPLSAAVEADRLEQLLTTEGRTPEPATRVILARVRNPAELPPSDEERRGLVAELVGRELEFATIVEAWQRARRGPAQLLHLTAAAGLGKSRLLADVHARLRASGARTVLVRATPGERHLPYAFAADLAAALSALPGASGVSPRSAAALVSLNPSLSSRYSATPEAATGAEAHRARMLALGELAQSVAHEAPTALLVDDVHWLDPQSRELLAGAVQRLGEAPVLVVTTGRNVPEGAAPTPAAREIALGPLSPEQVGALIASLGRLPDAPWAAKLAQRLHHATTGSPLLVLETLQLALETGTLDLRDGEWACPDPTALDALLFAGSALSRRIEALDRNARWVLLLLAVSGVPQTGDILALASGRPLEAVRHDLQELERRGLVQRVGDAWQPAHDETAARAEEAATAEHLRAALAALGRALYSKDEPAALRQACGHLFWSDDRETLRLAARRWLRSAFRAGRRDSLTALLRELLGSPTNERAVRALARRMPLRWRVGLTTPARIALAAATVTVAVVGGGLAFRLGDPPTMMLHVMLEGAGGIEEAVSIPLTERLLDGRGVLDLDRTAATAMPVAPPQARGWLPRPGGTLAAVMMTWPDSGGEEVVLVGPDGLAERLTNSPGDDGPYAWSPDGRYLVVGTDRWDRRSHSDLAIIDLADSAHPVRRLTDEPGARDANALWSPDGSRIAFVRRWYDGRPPELCVVTFDGSRRSCWRREGYTVEQLSGWSSVDELTVGAYDSAGEAVILRADPMRNEVTHLAWGVAGIVQPAGWVLCYCRRSRSDPLQSVLFHALTPERAIRLEPGDRPRWTAGVTHAPRRRISYLDLLRMRHPEVPIPAGGAFRLQVEGRDPAGNPTATPALAWSSADTTIAMVRGNGTVEGRREGSVSIVVSAGGWRTDSVRVDIGPPGSVTVLTESWSPGWEARWRPFGEPRPVIVTTDDGRAAFWNHGDSTFSSGAYTRTAFSAHEGLGVEVELSTPIRSLQWQQIDISLVPMTDAALDEWDHSTGYPPSRPGSWDACSGVFPSGDGDRSHVGLVAGIGSRVGTARDLAGGSWWRLRVQIFPDGTCGLAIDGQARAIGARQLTGRDPPRRLMLSGYSHGTVMLVRHVEVWTGVRQDVDWLAARR